MDLSLSSCRSFLKDIGVRVAGAAGAVGMIFLLVIIGDRFNIGFLQSQGGILISVIVLGELVFLSLLVFAVIRGDI